jgi:hypothetical protein
MDDGHNNGYTVEGHLPRVNTLAHNALNMPEFMDSQVHLALGNLFFRAPSPNWSALDSTLPFVWKLWCSFVSLSPWFTLFSLHPHGIVIYSLATMTRKRDRPRRGSAWYTHKARRQRKENMERALSLVTSILRKKARADQLALHTIIAETGAGCSSETTTIQSEIRPVEGVADAFPTCYVEEVPFMDLETTLEPQAMEMFHQDGSGPKFALADDILGCIVEEIPWPGDYNPTSHARQATVEEASRDKAREEEDADEKRPARKEEVASVELMELEAGDGVEGEMRDFFSTEKIRNFINLVQNYIRRYILTIKK